MNTTPMKTLSQILRDAILLLEIDFNREDVVIARGQQLEALEGQALRLLTSTAFQIRLWHDTNYDPDADLYKCERRLWLGTGWSPWKESRSASGEASFDLRDVLATDWRIVG